MGNCFRPGLPPEREREREIEREIEHAIYQSNEFWSFREDCCICMENPVQTAILNCGHVVLCRKCALLLKNSTVRNLNKCPICRSNIIDIVCFIPKNIE